MKQNSTPTTTQTAFDDVLHLIDSAKQRVYRAANTELIDLYWQVGELISKKIASAEWGDGVVAQLADFIAQTQPNYAVLRNVTYLECVNFMKLIKVIQKCHHW